MSDAPLLFEWRHRPHVAEVMATEMTSDFEKHEAWFRNSFNKLSYYHWIFGQADQDLGLVSISELNVDELRCSFGFYSADESLGQLGALVPAYMLNFLFSRGIKSVFGEVLETNTHVLRMHDTLGYHRNPALDREVEKDNTCLELIGFEITAEDWEIQRRFHRWKSEFPTLSWLARPSMFER